MVFYFQYLLLFYSNLVYLHHILIFRTFLSAASPNFLNQEEQAATYQHLIYLLIFFKLFKLFGTVFNSSVSKSSISDLKLPIDVSLRLGLFKPDFLKNYTNLIHLLFYK